MVLLNRRQLALHALQYVFGELGFVSLVFLVQEVFFSLIFKLSILFISLLQDQTALLVEDLFNLLDPTVPIICVMQMCRLHYIHVQVLVAAHLCRNHSQPVLNDGCLATENVLLTLVPNSVERVGDDGN